MTIFGWTEICTDVLMMIDVSTIDTGNQVSKMPDHLDASAIFAAAEGMMGRRFRYRHN